jgi:hypothetical protein
LTQIAEYTVKRLALIALVFLMVLSVATPFIQPAKAVTYSYTFNGPYNEVTGGLSFEPDTNATSVRITAYTQDGLLPSVHFYLGYSPDLNTTTYSYDFTYSVGLPPLYFSFDVIGTTNHDFHREYWLSPGENTGTYNIYIPTTATTYTLSFLDYTNLLETNKYIEAQKYFNGTYQTVERRLVDSQDIVLFDLVNGYKYQIRYGDGLTWTTYGDIVPTSVTGIQLVLRGVDFTSLAAKQQLLLYQYVHAYAQRDFLNPTGAITVSYEDLTSKTTSVLVTITNNGTTVYSGTFTAQTFSYTWNSAVNATSYEVTVAVNHQTFGLFDFKQYLLGEYQKADEPFSLAFLGSSMGISTAMLIPALLIIFVAGCFSELTSEVAAILTVIVAIVLTSLGWIDIGQGAIISTLALAVMSGIVAMKRRQGY